MAASPLTVIAVALAGSAATALTVSLVTAPAAGDAAAGDVTAELVARQRRQIEDLDAEVRRLSEQVAALELQAILPEPVTSEPLLVGEETVEARLDALETRLVPTAGGTPGSAALRDEVYAAVESIRAAEEAEEQARRAERDAVRDEFQLQQVVATLGLDGYQQGRMATLAAEFETRADELRELPELRDDRQARRDAWRGLEAELNAEAAKFLTPAQIALAEERGGLSPRGGFDDDGGRGRRGGGGD